MSHSLKILIENVINAKKDWKTLLLYQWQDIIGALHHKVTIEKIHDNTIILGVSHSSWMQELYLLSPLIIKTINEKLEHQYIKQVRFKHISIRKKITKKTTATMVYKKDIQLNAQDEYVLARVTDPALREAIRAFRMRCYRES